MRVKIYTTPTCPYCLMAKEFLKRNNVEFEEINVAVSREAALEMIKKSGQMGVPVLDIDGVIIVGFNKKEVVKALRLKGVKVDIGG